LHLGHQYTPHCQWQGTLAGEALVADRSAAKEVIQSAEAPLPPGDRLSDELRSLEELEEEAAAAAGGWEDENEEGFDIVDPFSFGLDSP
jgi:hypothetical protein